MNGRPLLIFYPSLCFFHLPDLEIVAISDQPRKAPIFHEPSLKLEQVDFLTSLLHYSLHFIFPGLIAWLFFRKAWQQAYLLMLLTMLVDLDHLLADPIFDPERCSIGFHPLHTGYAIVGYFFLFVHPKTRIVGLGLLLHMITDYIDCWL